MPAPATTGKAANAPAAPRLAYVPALDGLRALAVAAVVLYHSHLNVWPGGFLGVDVFFVLSGYLITCVLLSGYKRTGHMHFRQFWLARARRLLPALLLMLAVTAAYTALFLPDDAARFRGDSLAALGYVTNWFFIFGEQSYFTAIGRPSMVQHLWSLAVEEQFYLVWPLVMGSLLWIWKLRRKALFATVIAGAAVSASLMSLIYDPATDPSRVFYGTDTHAHGLLIGAALAIVWPAWRLTAPTGRKAPLILDTAGLVGLLALLWCFANLSEFDPSLYPGGYLQVNLVAALVVAVAVHPASRILKLLLGNAPMRWIGQRSYGIYLWHWPVFQVTRPELDVPLDGMPLMALRVGVTVGLAALSYKYVEMPVREGAIGRWLQTVKTKTGQRRIALRRLALAGLAGIAAVALLGAGLAVAEPADRPPGFESDSVRIEASVPAPGDTAPANTAPADTAPADTVPADPNAPVDPTATTAPAPAPAPPMLVTAIGDSVMLGAHEALVAEIGPGLTLDAAVSRQYEQALNVVRAMATAGTLGERVVLHLGTNGVIRPEQFAEMMTLLAGVPKVVVVNVAVPRPWEGPVNEVIANGVPNYPNAVLIDWKSFADAHRDLFVNDGVHLTHGGGVIYADIIAQNL